MTGKAKPRYTGEHTAEPIRDKKHIEAIKKALHGRNRLLFIFGINFGLRITDLLSLKVGDVRGKKYLIITEQKTGKGRRIDFSKAVLDEVKALEGDDSDYLFKSRKGGNKPITRQAAHMILNDAIERAGLTDKVDKISTHSLRKTFGYHMYKNGADLSLLQSIFSHSSQQITLRYIGIHQDDVTKAYKALSL